MKKNHLKLTEEKNIDQDVLVRYARKKQTELERVLSKLTKPKPTSGNLRIDKCKNSYQYYIINNPGDTRGTYLPRKHIRKAAAIAQRDYNQRAEATLKQQLAAIGTFLATYRPNALDNAFESLHPGRRALVTPLRETDEDFVAAWQHTPYTGKPFEVNAPEFYTASGVRVRSKSEVIIADALARAGVPYRYEYPVSVKGWGTLYPDFTCLRPGTRDETIWEHFGLMSDPDYAEVAIQKITRYAASGYILGKNLIASFETAETPLNLKQVQSYIKAHFK